MLPAAAAELRPDTVAAWDLYLSAPGQEACSGDTRFLRAPGSIEALRNGSILAGPAIRDNGMKPVPHGLIHHWAGAVFFPGAAMPDVLALAADYARYARIYSPLVESARLVLRSPASESFLVRSVHRAPFVTAAMDAEYESRVVHSDGQTACVVTKSTAIREIQNYGRPGERALPPGRGGGYVWRLATVARYEARDGGVYLEIEAIGLSRDIPAYLRPLVRPIAAKLSRNSLLTTLSQTRAALAAAATPQAAQW